MLRASHLYNIAQDLHFVIKGGSMRGSILKALQYLYCMNSKSIKEGKLKGLQLKTAFRYKKMVEDIAQAIEKKQINDLVEVLTYED